MEVEILAFVKNERPGTMVLGDAYVEVDKKMRIWVTTLRTKTGGLFCKPMKVFKEGNWINSFCLTNTHTEKKLMDLVKVALVEMNVDITPVGSI